MERRKEMLFGVYVLYLPASRVFSFCLLAMLTGYTIGKISSNFPPSLFLFNFLLNMLKEYTELQQKKLYSVLEAHLVMVLR
jgi:hypothetical protein